MEERPRPPNHPSHTHRRLTLTPQPLFPCQTARPGLTSADMGLVGGLHYKKLTTRLYFQAITPQQLAAFSHHLESTDPTLRVSALNLTNRQLGSPHYDIDLAVSYLVYVPQNRQQ